MLTKEDMRREIISIKQLDVLGRKELISFLLALREPMYYRHKDYRFCCGDKVLRFRFDEWIGTAKNPTIEFTTFKLKYKHLLPKSKLEVDDKFKVL